jgi:hypothetical protein
MHGGIEETKLLLRRPGIDDVNNLLTPERTPVNYGISSNQRTDEEAIEELVELHESVDNQ